MNIVSAPTIPLGAQINVALNFVGLANSAQSFDSMSHAWKSVRRNVLRPHGLNASEFLSGRHLPNPRDFIDTSFTPRIRGIFDRRIQFLLKNTAHERMVAMEELSRDLLSRAHIAMLISDESARILLNPSIQFDIPVGVISGQIIGR